MKKVYLISCTAKKQNYRCISQEMYSKSLLFRTSLDYALNRVNDKDSQIFVLSAKYGLLSLKKEIIPYNQTLKRMNTIEQKKWGKNVYQQMKKEFDIENTKFIFLAGQLYIKPIEIYLNSNNYINPIPKTERTIGKRIKWLKEHK